MGEYAQVLKEQTGHGGARSKNLNNSLYSPHTALADCSEHICSGS